MVTSIPHSPSPHDCGGFQKRLSKMSKRTWLLRTSVHRQCPGRARRAGIALVAGTGERLAATRQGRPGQKSSDGHRYVSLVGHPGKLRPPGRIG